MWPVENRGASLWFSNQQRRVTIRDNEPLPTKITRWSLIFRTWWFSTLGVLTVYLSSSKAFSAFYKSEVSVSVLPFWEGFAQFWIPWQAPYLSYLLKLTYQVHPSRHHRVPSSKVPKAIINWVYPNSKSRRLIGFFSTAKRQSKPVLFGINPKARKTKYPPKKFPQFYLIGINPDSMKDPWGWASQG